MTTTKNNESDFSARLRKLRGARTQRDFADFLGITSQQTYQNYERGRIPKTPVLQQIAQRTGVSIAWLLTGENTFDDSNISNTVRDDPHSYGKKMPLSDATMEILLAQALRHLDNESLFEQMVDYSKKADAGNADAARACALAKAEISRRINSEPAKKP